MGRCAGESSTSDAAVSRRWAMAWAYRNGLSVEPGWRSASTPSTSAAWLSVPDEPTQASTSPLALSSTTMAPSSTLRPASSRNCCCSACTAKRCSGARRVEVTVCGVPSDRAVVARVVAGAFALAAAPAPVPAAAPCCCASRRRAKCGATPALAAQLRRCSAPVTKRSSAPQSGAAAGAATRPAGLALRSAVPAACMLRSTPQARSATRAGDAFGARTSAAATAASRASRACAALPNSAWLSASMPTSSPRNGTRFR